MSTEPKYHKPNQAERLNYKSKGKCQDPLWAILYILHIIVVIVVIIYLCGVAIQDIKNNEDFSNPIQDIDSIYWEPILIVVIICGVSGLCAGTIWLQIMRLIAKWIIYLMLLLNLTLWIILFILGFVYWDIYLICFAGFFSLIFILYTILCWNIVTFSATLLDIGSYIVLLYTGAIGIRFCMIILDIIWLAMWAAMAASYGYIATENNDTSVEGWIIFLMILSLSWGICVNANISHTVSCGVAASWYFSRKIDLHPTWPAFKRAITTSFGSICLGSILVAICEAIRGIIQLIENEKYSASCRNFSLCCTNCLQCLLRYFNSYAFARCAIYGSPFCQSAKKIWELFTDSGVIMLVNDDLTHTVIWIGSLIIAVISAAIGYGIGWLYHRHDPDPVIAKQATQLLSIYGGLVGLIMCLCVLRLVKSSIQTIFVCYADDPLLFKVNRPRFYTKLLAANTKMCEIFRDEVFSGNVDENTHLGIIGHPVPVTNQKTSD